MTTKTAHKAVSGFSTLLTLAFLSSVTLISFVPGNAALSTASTQFEKSPVIKNVLLPDAEISNEIISPYKNMHSITYRHHYAELETQSDLAIQRRINQYTSSTDTSRRHLTHWINSESAE